MTSKRMKRDAGCLFCLALVMYAVGLAAVYTFTGVTRPTLPVSLNSSSKLTTLVQNSSRKQNSSGTVPLTTTLNGSMATSQMSVGKTVVPSRDECLSLDPPNFEGYIDHWQNVSDRKTNYVFSAHVNGGEVWVVGASDDRVTEKLYCQTWHKKVSLTAGQTLFTVETAPVRIFKIPFSYLRYSNVIFMCPLKTASPPHAVSIVTGKQCAVSLNAMSISAPREKKVNFSVCVTPFNFRYSRAYEIVEWIELNRILGAEHFTFYNYSIGPNVRKVLEMYSKRGLAEVVSWDLPMGVNKWPKTEDPVEIGYFAQSAALNDCLYRNRHSTEYLVFLDLDEFIVPKTADTKSWESMLKGLPVSDVYLFRNAFFRKDWPDDDSAYLGFEFAKEYRLTTQLKLLREEQIWQPEQRSKQIVKPTKVKVIGVHNVWKRVPGSGLLNVDPTAAMLHHYRNWLRPHDNIKRVRDESMLKYRNELIEAVNNTWMSLPGVELDLPIV